MQFLVSYLLLCTSTAKYVNSSTTDTKNIHPSTLITWLREKGGIFNSKLDIIGHDDQHSSSSAMGMTVLKDIPSNEILLRIPRPCLIVGGLPSVGDKVLVDDPEAHGKRDLVGEITFVNPDISFDLKFEDDNQEDQYEVNLKSIYKPSGKGSLECDAIRALVDELKLGSKSDFEPYINYLLDTKYGAKSPMNWSKAGKPLLQQVLGDELPPHNLKSGWQLDCNDLIENTTMMKIPPSWKNVFVPLLDMIHHHTKQHGVNTKIIVDLKNGVAVYASRNIKVGEEIYISYSSSTNGAPEALREYGIVQGYPQLWDFPKLGMKFEIYESKKSLLQAKWIQTGPLKAHNALTAQLQRLTDLNTTNFPLENSKSVPKNELLTINEYLQALITAITHAIQTKTNLLCYEDYVFDEYSELEQIKTNYQVIAFTHHVEKNDVCLSLGEKPDELMLQQCSSYRPHYHELFVHYTARYLDEVKRVIWIGGGDSMLLHEVLKYPSLEIVIGLEIDQTVTRKSFKYFGSQPHWNNQKVQWYYGDAAKSLLMLPKEYYGTFDLVLVDLSETVLSMSVNYEMDILTALGLLLKPQGILVKNDVYFNALSKVFKYTMELDYENPLPIPYLCVQPLVYGSNQVDFLTRSQKDYDVDVLWQSHIQQPLNDSSDPKAFDIWYNYGSNDIQSKTCQEQADFEKEPEQQDNSPGILMLLETEGISIDAGQLLQPKEFSKIIEEAAENEGLNVVTSTIHASNDDNTQAQIVTLLQQGYIVARTWPNLQYCAFDIHLWSSFEKLESIKKALITGVRSYQVSSYRIVAGGMFGVSTWKEDANKRGPKYTQTCDAQDDPDKAHHLKEEAPLNAASSIDFVLKESISSLIAEDSVRVGVVCGYENQACHSLDIVKPHDKVSDVLELWSCPNLVDDDNEINKCKESVLRKLVKFTAMTDDLDFDQSDEERDVIGVGDKVKAMLAGIGTWYFGTIHYINPDGTFDIAYDNGDMECELEPQFVKRLAKADLLLNQLKLRVLIIDSSVSIAMGKVINKLELEHYREKLFSNNMLVIVPVLDLQTRWKLNLVKFFTEGLAQMEEPVYLTDVSLHSNQDDSAFSLNIVSSGDYRFIKTLNIMISNVNQASLGVTSEVQSISRGDFFNAHSFKTFSQNFLPDDYDTTSSLAQWYSQKALGRQTIFQMAKVEYEYRFLNEDDILLVGDTVDVLFEETNTFYSGTVESINEDGTANIDYDDGDRDDEVERFEIKKGFAVNTEDALLSPRKIKQTIQSILSNRISQDFTMIGDGSVHTVLLAEGSVVVLWDGRNHLDVNLFTYDENRDFHNEFVTELVNRLPFLQVSLLDTQPRGIGSVINFSDDIEPNTKPIWA